jgi:glycosyltransferase involved in cell wall biosynthesis
VGAASVDARALISIVTPCLNRASFVAEAIESVLRQAYPRIEHIVVDGGSTDGTLEILAGYRHVRVISQPDEGVYDGLNKGIRLARGEIIGHLNSDDLYEDGVMPRVASLFASHPSLDAVYGGASVFEDGHDGKRRTIIDYLRPADIGLSPKTVTLGVPIVNARFFRKRVYDRIGLYDASYRIAGDREFLLRVMEASIPSAIMACRVYWYRQHPGSLTINRAGPTRHATLREHLRLAECILRRKGVPSDLKRVCREWHRREAVEGLVASVRGLRFGDAARYCLRGWRLDSWWPVVLPALLASRLRASVFRRWDG